MVDPQGDRDVGSDDEADGELKKAEDAYANECNSKPLNSRKRQNREHDVRARRTGTRARARARQRERERERERVVPARSQSGGSRGGRRLRLRRC